MREKKKEFGEKLINEIEQCKNEKELWKVTKKKSRKREEPY